jgi:hypothetical protein
LETVNRYLLPWWKGSIFLKLKFWSAYPDLIFQDSWSSVFTLQAVRKWPANRERSICSSKSLVKYADLITTKFYCSKINKAPFYYIFSTWKVKSIFTTFKRLWNCCYNIQQSGLPCNIAWNLFFDVYFKCYVILPTPVKTLKEPVCNVVECVMRFCGIYCVELGSNHIMEQWVKYLFRFGLQIFYSTLSLAVWLECHSGLLCFLYFSIWASMNSMYKIIFHLSKKINLLLWSETEIYISSFRCILHVSVLRWLVIRGLVPGYCSVVR